MTYSIRFTAVLDANVIFPVVIRDYLFWLAYYDLYIPKWSKIIFREWERVMIRKNMNPEIIRKQIQRVEEAFPDAMVSNYEGLINHLDLPDEDDRHCFSSSDKNECKYDCNK